ncbi:hypothetical protein HPB48_011994 [Haemaphysalis longicornis]|uniref:Uncharacterized protein n=1 Tax=Haemaphysalis longicornis TaxID=44386 RepID=A0A9J6H676_HAELO|nr:hypothetical protein HPB48_011994 [Haemaphysalis longicornis]
MTTPPATLEQPSNFAKDQQSDEEAMEDNQKAARALNQIRELTIDGKTHPVNIYGLATADSGKGVIYDVPRHYNMQQLLDDVYSPAHELLKCRRLGNTGIVVITFQGHKALTKQVSRAQLIPSHIPWTITLRIQI